MDGTLQSTGEATTIHCLLLAVRKFIGHPQAHKCVQCELEQGTTWLAASLDQPRMSLQQNGRCAI